MRFNTLFSIAQLVNLTLGYALYGGYERMWFWNMYLLDTAGTTIAPACAKTIGTGGARCNFNQFIQYINNINSPPSVDQSAFNDVDKGANALNVAGLTGTYDATRVLPTVSTQGNIIGNLFDGVGRFGYKQQNVKGAGKGALVQARTAVQRVQFLRGVENLNEVQNLIQRNHPDAKIVTFKAYLYSGAPDPTTVFNKAATIKLNPGIPTIADEIEADARNDPNHIGNVLAATRARGNTQGCTAPR